MLIYLEKMFELETAITKLFLAGAVDNAARVEILVRKTTVGAQQVRFDAARWLHGHLRSVLQDVHRELGTWHARQPDAEVLVHLENRSNIIQKCYVHDNLSE